MMLVHNFCLSVPFSLSVTHFPFISPPPNLLNPPLSHKHHLLFPSLSLSVAVCNPVQDPDNIWAHWPVMILTRHNLPAPICQPALIPDTHMYTSVTLKRTANDTELNRQNTLMVSVAPELLMSPRGTHPNHPNAPPPTHTHTNTYKTVLHPSNVSSHVRVGLNPL